MTGQRLADHDVHVERGVLARAGELLSRALPDTHRVAIITDENVGPLYAARLLDDLGRSRALELRVPAGEGFKTRAQWSALTDRLLEEGCGRDTAIVALGGGVIGDLAGFVAATFMRGVSFIQVPTSLLAMVDASIGGKTGVDTPHGKNLVGAFHAPALVLVDPLVLETLPGRELRAGAAEMLKHGAIADVEHFDELATELPALLGRPADAAWERLIRRSAAIKLSIVAADPRERGRRKVLNFGHTLGHAIETAADYRLLHGECVAIGMVLESRLAERTAVADRGTAERIESVVRAAGLPVSRPAKVAPERVLDATRIDKKSRRGQVEYALPARVGEMASSSGGWSIAVPDSIVLEVLR